MTDGARRLPLESDATAEATAQTTTHATAEAERRMEAARLLLRRLGGPDAAEPLALHRDNAAFVLAYRDALPADVLARLNETQNALLAAARRREAGPLARLRALLARLERRD